MKRTPTTAIHLSKEAQESGADGLLLVSPYYNKATQNGLYAHFKAVADSVKLPIILYNVPSRTGCNIAPETILRLCTDVVTSACSSRVSVDDSPVVPQTMMASVPSAIWNSSSFANPS